MPIIVCPHCRQPLTAHASPYAVLVRCPACGQPFTVPAASSEQVTAGGGPWVAEEVNPFTITDSPTRRPRARSSSAWQWSAVAGIVLVICLGLWYVHWMEQQKQLERELVEFLTESNRAGVTNQEYIFWISISFGTSADAEISAASRVGMEKVNRLDERLTERWGYHHKGLKSVNRRKGDAFTTLKDSTERYARIRLETNNLLLQSELNSNRTETRETIIHRWIKRTNDEIMQRLATLEMTFLTVD